MSTAPFSANDAHYMYDAKAKKRLIITDERVKERQQFSYFSKLLAIWDQKQQKRTF